MVLFFQRMDTFQFSLNFIFAFYILFVNVFLQEKRPYVK